MQSRVKIWCLSVRKLAKKNEWKEKMHLNPNTDASVGGWGHLIQVDLDYDWYVTCDRRKLWIMQISTEFN